MLSVSVVPSLIVIDNKSGRVITLRGMEAIQHVSVNDIIRNDNHYHQNEQQQQEQEKQQQKVGEEQEEVLRLLIHQWRQGKSGIPWMMAVVSSCVVC